jgi:hypothetical protein
MGAMGGLHALLEQGDKLQLHVIHRANTASSVFCSEQHGSGKAGIANSMNGQPGQRRSRLITAGMQTLTSRPSSPVHSIEGNLCVIRL